MQNGQFACPVAFPVVMPVQLYFVITRDKGPFRIFRRPFDCIASRLMKTFDSVQLIRSIHCVEIQDLLPRPPVSRINNQVPNCPRLVIDDKVPDVANLAVLGLDVVASHVCGATEMRILVCRATRGIGVMRAA